MYIYVYIFNVACWSAIDSGASIAHVIEGISLFGATPHFGSIPVGGTIIPTSYIVGEIPSIEEFPIDSEVPMLEEIHT